MAIKVTKHEMPKVLLLTNKELHHEKEIFMQQGLRKTLSVI